MSKRLVEIWKKRSRPLLSERGLRLLLRERGLKEAQINSILKEISFLDLLKKPSSFVRDTVTNISAAAGKAANTNLKLKAIKWWKKYAAGADIPADTPPALDFFEWLEDTYRMPESIINRLKIGNKSLVDIVEKEPRNLTKDELDDLFSQIAREEFKYLQSGTRYGSRFDSRSTHSHKGEEFLNVLRNTVISDENLVKLKKTLENNPKFLDQLLTQALKNNKKQ